MTSIRTAGLTRNFRDLRAVNAIDLDMPEGVDTTGPACPDEPQATIRSDHQCKR